MVGTVLISGKEGIMRRADIRWGAQSTGFGRLVLLSRRRRRLPGSCWYGDDERESAGGFELVAQFRRPNW